MKKILAAFDGLKYSESTERYAIQFALDNHAHLVGVFLEDYSYTGFKIYDLLKSEPGALDVKRRKLEKKDQQSRASSVVKFETACKKAKVSYSIHKDRDIAIRELLKESIYADLLIIDRKENLMHHPENIPTAFIRDLLSEVQCPVLLVPSKFTEPDKLTLLFDGEPSSVYAVKMISYMWNDPVKFPVEILTVIPPDHKTPLKNFNLMKEFIRRHFAKAVFTELKGFPEPEITNYLRKEKKAPIVALGAYRRGKISRWFRGSMADILMRELKLPLFIAHAN